MKTLLDENLGWCYVYDNVCLSVCQLRRLSNQIQLETVR